MPSNPNTRTMGQGGVFASLFISALSFASPAQAETATFVCEGETRMNMIGIPSPGNWTLDIDYSANRVKFGEYPFVTATIGDREITFIDRMPSGVVMLIGVINRLAGTIQVAENFPVGDINFGNVRRFNARCRPATTRI